MTLPRRPHVLPAFLAAILLMTLAVPTTSAHVRHARAYRVGGAITLDTNLLSMSGASAWAINEYLAAKTALPPLGKAFLAAERKYGVNARFLLAAAMHESAWGTSAIARVKHNLFGYNAYDRDPFRYATAYATYAANIDATAKFIKGFYLTRGGRWWGGAPTLRSMQRFWSSSGRWGEGVSRIVNSIHLGRIVGRALTFAIPIVPDGLNGGDRASVRLPWAGGPLPAGVEFVARWVPVELDADAIANAIAATRAAPVTAHAPAPEPPPDAVASPPAEPVTNAAPRSRARARSITLSVRAPSQAGRYLLEVGMRDTGGRPLPAVERVRIPSAAVRVWGDRAIRIDVEPGLDGTSALVRITNTGREAIPAAPGRDADPAGDPEAGLSRSVVTVTASSSGTSDAAPIQVLTAPLAADLPPGASATFHVTGIAAATRRATNWLSVNLGVLGDTNALTPYTPVGAWLTESRSSAAAPPATTSAPLPAATPAATPLPVPTARPTASLAPIPAPIATPTAPTTPKVQATPKAPPTPKAPATPKAPPTPKATATPTPRHVTHTFSEHSRAITYRGRWADATGAYAGGNVTWSKSAGSTATLSFTGTSVKWIGPVGPTRGLVLVLVDGRAVTKVSLWRSSYDSHAVLFKRSFPTSGRHTLSIKVLSSAHPCVAIDAFVVRS